MHLTRRLSKSFILLDFLYGHGNYTNLSRIQPLLANLSEDTFQRGVRFCNEFLEPLIEEYGQCTIANGLRFYCNGAHLWQKSTGCAADVVFFDWVNENRAPVNMMSELDQNGVEFERFISYAGTEFMCVAWKPEGGNRSAFYENKKNPKSVKPFYINYGSQTADRKKRYGIPVPRRRDWKREEHETVYHTQRSLRAQHIRVGQYFTLLDFCRNAEAFCQQINTVPPMDYLHTYRTKVARMFAEVLDPIVIDHGRVSVVRGMEQSVKALGTNCEYRWTASRNENISACTIAVPNDSDECILSELVQSKNVIGVDCWDDSENTYYEIHIEHFEPSTNWSSHK